VARAKRTDRAEARRRYRASLGEEEPIEDLDESVDDDPIEAARPSGRDRVRAASATPSPAPQRPSIVRAFSSSFKPVDLRGDLASLPALVRHRSFLIPLALIAAAAVAFGVMGAREPLVYALSQYLLFPPPVAAVFLAGFLAPRASWLLGAVLGAIATGALVAALSSPALQASVGTPISTDLGVGPLVILAYSSIGGALFAAVAAWYKRFLFLANPARAARAGARPNDRQQRRKGSQNRPILARRR
jgi:hypothetical protein